MPERCEVNTSSHHAPKTYASTYASMAYATQRATLLAEDLRQHIKWESGEFSDN